VRDSVFRALTRIATKEVAKPSRLDPTASVQVSTLEIPGSKSVEISSTQIPGDMIQFVGCFRRIKHKVNRSSVRKRDCWRLKGLLNQTSHYQLSQQGGGETDLKQRKTLTDETLALLEELSRDLVAATEIGCWKLVPFRRGRFDVAPAHLDVINYSHCMLHCGHGLSQS
jgi:hypothetical protein